MRKKNKLLLPFLILTLIVIYAYRSGYFYDFYNSYFADQTSEELSTSSVNQSNVSTEITQTIIKANIEVLVTSYNSILGIFEYEGKTMQGSGVIFDEDNNYYYAFSNFHVIAPISGYEHQRIRVLDYNGLGYNASIISSDINYDLAVLRFRKSYIQLMNLELGTSNPTVNTQVAAIGQPKGQRNVVTFGKIIGYGYHQLEDESISDVNFNVIEHNARIESGNSGGVLINLEYKIIGINYAAATDKEGNYIYGLAIPISRLKEYLVKYNYQFT